MEKEFILISNLGLEILVSVVAKVHSFKVF
jgi:hypothetical protein